MTPCDEIRINLGGYVLDGLPAEERDWVDEHLRDCATCRAELAELAELPSLLALVADAPPAPPEQLRGQVVAAAPRPRAPRRRVLMLVAAALGLGMLVGLAVVPTLLGLGRPQPVTVALAPGEGFDARGSASFVSTAAGLQVQLELEDLPALPPEAVYEAWLTVPGTSEPTSIGRFARDPDGTALVTLAAQGDLADYQGVWVTAEPDSSDRSHAGPTVLAARFNGGAEENWPSL